MKLIRDIDKDITRQSPVKSFVEFASLANTYPVAEGIETEKELLTLIDLGVHYGQGFFIKKPSLSTDPISSEVMFIISEANRKKNHLSDQKSSELYIGNISTAQKTINPRLLIKQIYNLMEEDPSVSGFCITEEGYISGIITRSEENFPLTSISIVGVLNSKYKNVCEMTEEMAALKKICKQNTGNNYLI